MNNNALTILIVAVYVVGGLFTHLIIKPESEEDRNELDHIVLPFATLFWPLLWAVILLTELRDLLKGKN